MLISHYDCSLPVERKTIDFCIFDVGEGNGNQLQYSCLENPRDRQPGGLPSMGLHRVGHDWSDLAANICCILAPCYNHLLVPFFFPIFKLLGILCIDSCVFWEQWHFYLFFICLHFPLFIVYVDWLEHLVKCWVGVKVKGHILAFSQLEGSSSASHNQVWCNCMVLIDILYRLEEVPLYS